MRPAFRAVTRVRGYSAFRGIPPAIGGVVWGGCGDPVTSDSILDYCLLRNEENPRISPIREGGRKRAHSRAPLHYCRCDPTGPGHHSGRTPGAGVRHAVLTANHIRVFCRKGPGNRLFAKSEFPAFLSLRLEGILRPCGIEHEFRWHCLTERGDCFEPGAMGRHDVVRFQRLDALYGCSIPRAWRL